MRSADPATMSRPSTGRSALSRHVGGFVVGSAVLLAGCGQAVAPDTQVIGQLGQLTPINAGPARSSTVPHQDPVVAAPTTGAVALTTSQPTVENDPLVVATVNTQPASSVVRVEPSNDGPVGDPSDGGVFDDPVVEPIVTDAPVPVVTPPSIVPAPTNPPVTIASPTIPPSIAPIPSVVVSPVGGRRQAVAPSEAAIISVVDHFGVKIPVLDGWTAFATLEAIAASPTLNKSVQGQLFVRLQEDPTRAVFIPDDELGSADPSMVLVTVRTQAGLSGPDAVARIMQRSLETEKFSRVASSTFSWRGLLAGSATLSAQGLTRHVVAATNDQDRLCVIQSTGRRGDLAAVHERLVVEVNPRD